MELPRSKPLGTHVRKVRAAAGFVVGLLAVPAALYFSQPRNPTWAVASAAEQARTPERGGPQLRDGYSNIHAGDYVGPQKCGECHSRQYHLWRKHPHSRMNQNATEQSVLGDFSGRRLRYGQLSAVFDRDGEHYRMSFRIGAGQDAVKRRYRVTRTVGSRFTQMYIGVQSEGPEPSSDPVYHTERKLPFGYWMTRGRWLPVNYFDTDFLPDYPDDDSADNSAAIARLFRGNPWERNCIYCHNTYPYVERLRSGLEHMPGFPHNDLWLESKSSEDAERPSQADLQRRRHLSDDKLVSLGISCESCHFGGRIHAADDDIAPRFVPTAPDLAFPAATAALVRGARDSNYVVSSICAQCHSAQSVGLYPNGAGTWNSREALDMFGGACASEIKCTDCHEPHTKGPAGGSAAEPKHIAACVQCHKQYAEPERATAHSRHGGSVTCLDCHMPRMVQGLDAVVRTHHISSPTDEEMLGQGSPNACNLCHLDRSLRWTLAELSRGWPSAAPSPSFAESYAGDLDAPMAKTWLEHEVPITRLVLTDALARSASAEVALPMLSRLLDDPNPVNRMFALFAVETLLGRRLSEQEYQPAAAPKARREQIERLSLTRGAR